MQSSTGHIEPDSEVQDNCRLLSSESYLNLISIYFVALFASGDRGKVIAYILKSIVNAFTPKWLPLSVLSLVILVQFALMQHFKYNANIGKSISSWLNPMLLFKDYCTVSLFGLITAFLTVISASFPSITIFPQHHTVLKVDVEPCPTVILIWKQARQGAPCLQQSQGFRFSQTSDVSCV